jgi:methylenetetrahydrofolate dehydrogenase (NADP+)/methenyltetrahydrofolate cyclohydrolase
LPQPPSATDAAAPPQPVAEGAAGGGVLLDGRAAAEALREQTAARVTTLTDAGRTRPGLATVLVGEDPASEVYVAAKGRACEAVGIRSFHRQLPGSAKAARVRALITELNDDPEVSGILVQMPLPDGHDPAATIDLVDPRKDVEGLSAANVGLLTQGRPGLAPCTPLAVMTLLERAGVELRGCDVAVVGASPVVGRPLATMLSARDATVILCQRYTRGLAAKCRGADVVVAAAGVPCLIGASHVREGAVVVDVGINRTAAGLVGDVDFDAVRPRAAAITPVPGGVGPMTTACLLANTVRAAELLAG